MNTIQSSEISHRSLSRKQSTRRLQRPENLGSSELTPSEHSSLYDATPLKTASPLLRDDWCSESSNGEDTKPTLQEPGGAEGQPDVGKHVGTRLFTIAEQKSVPSLRTAPSSWDVQRRVLSLQPQLSVDVAQARHSRGMRRRCYSANDCAPGIYHTCSNAEATSDVQSTEQQIFSPSVLPIKPPYRPPERIQTPLGLPRWPGETDHDQFTVRQLAVRTSRRYLLREYLRRPPSRPKLKEVLRGERVADLGADVRTGTRFWRPPSSGHTTRRYDDIETHPFSNMLTANPSARAPRILPVTEGEGRPASQLQSGNLVVRDRKIQNAAPERLNAVSGSTRAFRCIGQNAVPVSLRRASTQASARSAAVPANVRISPVVETDPNQTVQSHGLSTVRMMDHFESFPSPPRQQRGREQASKRCAWSLFPASSRHDSVKDQIPRLSGSHMLAGSGGSGASNVAIRGESQARYRHSGTPIYGSDGISLRMIERERQVSNENDGSSLATNAFGTRLHTENQRAISNGALRFSFRTGTPIAEPRIGLRSMENQNPRQVDRPEPHQLCKHNLAKLRCRQKKNGPINYNPTQLDGSSASIPPPPIAAQDHALPVFSIDTQPRSSTATAPHVNRPPTTTTFVTAPNGATTFTTSPTAGPSGRFTTNTRTESPLTMPGRA